MRSFSEKDFLAIHSISNDAKLRLNRCAAKAVRRLGLKPTRKGHGLKFSKDELLIEHTTSLRDIEAFIDSVTVPLPLADTGNRRTNRKMASDQQTLFAEACEKVCKIFVLTNIK